MKSHHTNTLLNMCRIGVGLKNEKTDTAARELCSYIVFASLLEDRTTLPVMLEERAILLQDAAENPTKYPQDIFPEEEDVHEVSLDDGPEVA